MNYRKYFTRPPQQAIEDWLKKFQPELNEDQRKDSAKRMCDNIEDNIHMSQLLAEAKLILWQ